MHALSFYRQLGHDVGNPLLLQVPPGEQKLMLCLAIDDVLSPLVGQNRHRLEAPFLIRDALQRLIAIEGDFLLPVAWGFLVLLPGGPGLVGLDGDLVENGAVLGSFLVQLLAVEQRAPRRDGQQEQAHRELPDWEGGRVVARKARVVSAHTGAVGYAGLKQAAS